MDKVKVKINPSKKTSYSVLIGEKLLNKAYDYISKVTNANKFLIVTNETVYPLYGEKLRNKKSEFIILPDGEMYKNMDILNKILDKALEIKLERKDAMIALGGGVVGDITGFAAAIYQRGIDFIQIPTTLLAQVDSSVGGKVAVNHFSGKNLIGAFYQPKLVISDTCVLNTLSDRQFKTGLSEILKYAFIEKSCANRVDFNLFGYLKAYKDEIYNKNPKILKKLIKMSCELKSCVVNKDEKEKGLRAILNFGHTYAHAIEKLTHYEKYTHGEAVSIGMKMIFELAHNLEYISEEYYKNSVELINDYGLKTSYEEKFEPEEFYNAMFSDKKVADNKINFVMPIKERSVAIKNNIDKKYVIKGIK